jgi:hypothetical protein
VVPFGSSILLFMCQVNSESCLLSSVGEAAFGGRRLFDVSFYLVPSDSSELPLGPQMEIFLVKKCRLLVHHHKLLALGEDLC